MIRTLRASAAAALLLAAAAVSSAETVGPPLAPPSAVRLRVVPEGFSVAWDRSGDDPGDVTGYEVARATLFTGPYRVVARVEAGVTTVIDPSAIPEHIYFYRVRAVGKRDASAWSSEAAGEKPGVPRPGGPP